MKEKNVKTDIDMQLAQSGYTRFPRTLARLQGTMTPSEWCVLTYIVDRSLGWNTGSAEITYDEFMHGRTKKDGTPIDHGCGVTGRATLSACLKSLEEKGHIARYQHGAAHGPKMRVSYAPQIVPETKAATTESEEGDESDRFSSETNIGSAAKPTLVQNLNSLYRQGGETGEKDNTSPSLSAPTPPILVGDNIPTPTPEVVASSARTREGIEETGERQAEEETGVDKGLRNPYPSGESIRRPGEWDIPQAMWSPPSGSSSASDPADLLAGVIRASVERGTGSPLPSSQRDALLSGCRSYLARATSSSDMSPHAAASEAMRAWAWRDRVWGRMGGFSFSDANISAERIISSAVSSWRKAMAAPPPTSDEADPFPPIRQTAEAKAAVPSLANPTMTMGDIPF